MRRLLSLVLALAVAASSAAVSSLHVHAYGGHDHPEHQHGPAAHLHDHEHTRPHAVNHDHGDVFEHDGDTAVAHLEACDPGGHAVRIPAGYAPISQGHLHLAVLPGPVIVEPVLPVHHALALTDIRVHGPPFDAQVPARAPPLTLSA